MEFSDVVERYLADKPQEFVERAEALVDGFPEKEWSIGRGVDSRRNSLVAEKHAANADIADWHRSAEQYNVFDDAAAAIPSSVTNGPTTLALRRAERRKDRALEALAKLERQSKVPAGRTTWSTKAPEVNALLTKLARDNAALDLFALKGKPSRKGMAEAAKVADAGHARLKAVTEAHVDKATAEAMVRGLVREESPLHLALADFHMAETLRIPLVGAKWGPGREQPLPEDTAAMFNFVAGERILDDLLDQVERRYAGFAERGVLTLTPAERKREMTIAREAIHRAELEEAGHLFGLAEADGTLIRPPARIGARALLGIL
jgi:hypothetical protein